MFSFLKLHWFDWLWICSIGFDFVVKVVQQIHNRTKHEVSAFMIRWHSYSKALILAKHECPNLSYSSLILPLVLSSAQFLPLPFPATKRPLKSSYGVWGSLVSDIWCKAPPHAPPTCSDRLHTQNPVQKFSGRIFVNVKAWQPSRLKFCENPNIGSSLGRRRFMIGSICCGTVVQFVVDLLRSLTLWLPSLWAIGDRHARRTKRQEKSCIHSAVCSANSLSLRP